MNITFILYRPAQKGEKKPEVQHQATVQGVCRTQMEPRAFTGQTWTELNHPPKCGSCYIWLQNFTGSTAAAEMNIWHTEVATQICGTGDWEVWKFVLVAWARCCREAEFNTENVIPRGEVEARQLLQGQGRVSAKISFLFTDD